MPKRELSAGILEFREQMQNAYRSGRFPDRIRVQGQEYNRREHGDTRPIRRENLTYTVLREAEKRRGGLSDLFGELKIGNDRKSGSSNRNRNSGGGPSLGKQLVDGLGKTIASLGGFDGVRGSKADVREGARAMRGGELKRRGNSVRDGRRGNQGGGGYNKGRSGDGGRRSGRARPRSYSGYGGQYKTGARR